MYDIISLKKLLTVERIKPHVTECEVKKCAGNLQTLK